MKNKIVIDEKALEDIRHHRWLIRFLVEEERKGPTRQGKKLIAAHMQEIAKLLERAAALK